MAEDLGTWPSEQAMVLLEVLQSAGLSPDAKRTREGILVTVPDEQSDEAHRQLVANMDTIARAAKQPRPAPGPRRRPRPVKGADHPEQKDPRQLASERMLRLAKPLGVLLIALILISVLRGSPIVIAAIVGVLIYLIGRRAQRQGGSHDPDH